MKHILCFTSLCLLLYGSCSFAQEEQSWVIANIHKPDPELGYSGIPLASGKDSLFANGRYVYNVVLRLDSHGLREVPGRPKEPAEFCVLTIGDSIPFGIGVEASETVAGLIQRHLGAKVRVFNFGYTGYGPHQNLRFLETGREKELLKGCKKTISFQFVMEDHSKRAVGRGYWGLSAPKYILDNQRPRYVGPRWPEWINKLNNNMSKNPTYRDLISFLLGYNRTLSSHEKDLYRAILVRIQEILNERYQSEFSLIYFGKGAPPPRETRELLASVGKSRFFEELADGTDVLSELYLGDRTHINAKGHELVAASLIKDIKAWMQAP
jgi:hypothetical protein